MSCPAWGRTARGASRGAAARKARGGADLIAYYLGDLGPHSKDLVPALCKALDNEDTEVRSGAAKGAAHRPGHRRRLGVPVLARLAADKDYKYRKYALEHLGESAPRLGPRCRSSSRFSSLRRSIAG